MNKVVIISDSTCDLGKELASKYDVKILPLFVTFGEESYLDGETITTEELYEKIKDTKQLPKTAAIPEPVLEDAFREAIDAGCDVIFTGISKDMSCTYNNACMAAEEVGKDRVFVVDSKNLSTGIGLTVLKACKYRDQGLSAAEIAKLMENDVNRVYAQFAIDTFEYLYKGGRCSSLSMIVGSLLRIKPLIAVRDGKMHVAKKPIGKLERALDIMIEQITNDKDRIDTDHIFVTHSVADKYVPYIVDKIKPIFPNIEILVTEAGSVISSHCGKNTIGILYMVKE